MFFGFRGENFGTRSVYPDSAAFLAAVLIAETTGTVYSSWSTFLISLRKTPSFCCWAVNSRDDSAWSRIARARSTRAVSFDSANTLENQK